MLDVHPQAWRDVWFKLIPGARLCEPAELKGTYVYLASNASSYMTGKSYRIDVFFPIRGFMLIKRTGANLVIDGGYTLP